MMIRLVLPIFCAGTLMTTSACAQEQDVQNQPEQSLRLVEAEATLETIAQDWRDIDPENTLYITTDYGTFVIEFAPEFAPNHVTQIKTLARQKFYDNITFHRVIKDFMNQTGDPKGDGTGSSALPDLGAEFTFRRPSNMSVTLVGKELYSGGSGEIDTGFYKAFPLATQPIAQSILTKDGKVEAWGLHCPRTTSMARSGEPNSANSQFFLMRGIATQLNQQYSVWGAVVWGREGLTRIKVGSVGEDKNFVPDVMRSMRVGSDVPQDERLAVQVMKTDGAAFQTYLEGLKSASGKLPAVCDITVPTRLKP